MKTCTILLDKYGGEIPRTRDALEALPGVGRKTANVVLNTAFGRAYDGCRYPYFPACKQDANRSGQRCQRSRRPPGTPDSGILKGCTPLDDFARRYVCKARKPDCPNCLISDLCEYKGKPSG